jgi:8-oxo-dGTP pyrophosphatase MutT (NUDIX family)
MQINKNIHVLSRAVIIDQGQILLCKTLKLAINFYFLPGGHVEHNESVEMSLIRELMEETGAKIVIKRFLGCLEYRFDPGHNSVCHNHEYNFIFEASSETLKCSNIIPQLEDHIELMWVAYDQLSKIDFRAEPLQKLVPFWLQSDLNSSFNSVME